MNLEEIITAAVERRIADIVEEAVKRRDFSDTDKWDEKQPSRTSLEGVVSRMVDEIAKEEVQKHHEMIRGAVLKTLAQEPGTIKVSAYTEIRIPRIPSDQP